MNDIKSISIKKYILPSFVKWLDSRELTGKESRVRTHLVKELQKRVVEIVEQYNEMIKSFADKDEKGEFIIENINIVNGEQRIKYKISKDSELKLGDEIRKFNNELVIIDVLPSNEKTLLQAKELLIKSNDKFSAESILPAFFYDELCEEFEKLSEVNETDELIQPTV